VLERVETNPGQGGAPLTLDKLPNGDYVQPLKIMLAGVGDTGPLLGPDDPMPVSGTALTAIATGVGAPADAVATTDTGTFSLLAFFKRALQNWTTLLARTTPGQAVAASSLPVVIASNQTAVPVSGTFWQGTQPVSVASWTGLTDAQLRAAAVPVSAASLPLPAGAATAAAQATLVTALTRTAAGTGAADALPVQGVAGGVPQTVTERSLNVGAGGTCSVLTVSATSQQSAVIGAADVVISPLVDIYIRRGANPTALATGVDQILLAGIPYRDRCGAGERYAVIAVNASAVGGLVQFAPGA
jgi:hypothetical protein